MKKILHTLCIALCIFSFSLMPTNGIAQNVNGLSLGLKGASISEIYPNPAEQVAHFDYELAAPNQKASVEIYSLIGAIVWMQELPSTKGTVSVALTNFKRGIYFYRLKVGGEKTSVRKLVVR